MINEFCNELETEKTYTANDMCSAYNKGKNEQIVYSPFGYKFNGNEEELKQEWREYTKWINNIAS